MAKTMIMMAMMMIIDYYYYDVHYVYNADCYALGHSDQITLIDASFEPVVISRPVGISTY